MEVGAQQEAVRWVISGDAPVWHDVGGLERLRGVAAGDGAPPVVGLKQCPAEGRLPPPSHDRPDRPLAAIHNSSGVELAACLQRSLRVAPDRLDLRSRTRRPGSAVRCIALQ